MKINWKVRLKNPTFWVGLIGAVASFVIAVAQLFGLDIAAEVGGWEQALSALATAIFGVLALLGVVTDPTTKGVSDSQQALGYTKPRKG